jgi:hypothetical protein
VFINSRENQVGSHCFSSFFELASLSLFGSVVVIAFQIAFRAKIHANDVFLFFKNYF